MDTLMDDSLIYTYEYNKGKIRNLNINVLREKKRYFCIYDNIGNYRYLSSYNNDTLKEEIGVKFNFNNSNYDTFYYFKRFNNYLYIYFTNYGYLLTTYKYKNLEFNFNYYEHKKTTYIRKSNINYRKLKRYKLIIEDVFKDLNKFFPNAVFVLFDDTENKKGPLPDE